MTADPERESCETPKDSGVDRTLIRQRLALTPAERARLAVESARNVVRIKTNLRRTASDK